MQLGSALASASSGMRVQTQRLAQSAANVANVNTDGYPAQTDSMSVQRAGQREAAPAAYNRFAMPVSQAASQTIPSGTDLVSETLTQISSEHAFRANVAVLRASDAMLGDLLDLNA
jgi:flagellar basal body rod protein FlgG